MKTDELAISINSSNKDLTENINLISEKLDDMDNNAVKERKKLATDIGDLKNELEIVKVTFSPDGFLTVEEKDLRTILLGYKPNLINYQLQIMNNIKNEFRKNNFSIKIDNIDLTNPDKPKIKVFKP